MKHRQQYITKSAKETQNIAKKLALQVLQKKVAKQAIVLSLKGNLGAGKTTFLQGFAKGMGISHKVTSPTFVIAKRFPMQSQKIKNQKSKSKNTNQKLKFADFYHIDCYRLEKEKDLEVLGLKEIISNPENIVAIEWAEKISKALPQKKIKIEFEHLKKDKRKITIFDP